MAWPLQYCLALYHRGGNCLNFLWCSFIRNIQHHLDPDFPRRTTTHILDHVFFVFAFFASTSRFLLKIVHDRTFQKGREPVAIYGAGDAGRQLASAFNHSGKFFPVLFIDDDKRLSGQTINGLRVYQFQDGVDQFARRGIRTVLLAIPSAPQARQLEVSKKLSSLGIELSSVPSFKDLVSNKSQIHNLRSLRIEELLGREPIEPIGDLLNRNISGKSVLVTGAGGSIGSELCRQIVRQRPKKLILLEISEAALYQINEQMELEKNSEGLEVEIIPMISSIADDTRVRNIVETFEVQTIYHAAAYKHVPLMELNVGECIRNNCFGTDVLAKAALTFAVENFILVSTDKAVRPTNIMGASKRIAELICQSYSTLGQTKFSMVRFGNVLASSGSVIPKFERQIASEGL